ncbi:MAG: hypothetical protein ACHQ4J_15580 [Candidatus Binatia bacterium]
MVRNSSERRFKSAYGESVAAAGTAGAARSFSAIAGTAFMSMSMRARSVPTAPERLFVGGERRVQLRGLVGHDLLVFTQAGIHGLGELFEMLLAILAELGLEVLAPHGVERIRRRHLAPQAGGQHIQLIRQILRRRDLAARDQRVELHKPIAQALQAHFIGQQGDRVAEFLLCELRHTWLVSCLRPRGVSSRESVRESARGR